MSACGAVRLVEATVISALPLPVFLPKKYTLLPPARQLSCPRSAACRRCTQAQRRPCGCAPHVNLPGLWTRKPYSVRLISPTHVSDAELHRASTTGAAKPRRLPNTSYAPHRCEHCDPTASRPQPSRPAREQRRVGPLRGRFNGARVHYMMARRAQRVALSCAIILAGVRRKYGFQADPRIYLLSNPANPAARCAPSIVNTHATLSSPRTCVCLPSGLLVDTRLACASVSCIDCHVPCFRLERRPCCGIFLYSCQLHPANLQHRFSVSYRTTRPRVLYRTTLLFSLLLFVNRHLTLNGKLIDCLY